MAICKTCLGDSKKFNPSKIRIGTALIGPCEKIYENLCKGNGQTPGSLYQYCQECSEYYKICEMCGRKVVVSGELTS